METSMKKSAFQFKDPQLINLIFSINDSFDNELFEDIDLKSKTEICKADDENIAFVELNLKIGDESAPFIIEITMGSHFKWDTSINKDIDMFLSYNAPALLLGYMRPIVSLITAKSKYPEFNIPFIDFRPINNCDNKNKDCDDD